MVLIGYLIPVAALAALVYALVRALAARRRAAGGDRLREVAGAVRGAVSAWRGGLLLPLAVFAVLAGGGLAAALHVAGGLVGWPVAAFAAGLILAFGAWWAGLGAAGLACSRGAAAAETGSAPAHRLVFCGGAVLGACAVGLALLGIDGLFLLFKKKLGIDVDASKAGLFATAQSLGAFGLGAACVALFARVAGGIFARASHSAVDLVRQAEKEVPEDDARNPAGLARLAGTQVGAAGLGAELLAAFAGSLVAAVVLGTIWAWPIHHTNRDFEASLVMLPLVAGGLGAVCGLLGKPFARAREGASPAGGLHVGLLFAQALVLAAGWFVLRKLVPYPVASMTDVIDANRLFLALAAGPVAGILAGLVVEFAAAGKAGESRGAALEIAGALVAPALVAAAAGLAYHAVGLYGVALSAVGFVSTAGIQAAVGAYGPLARTVRGLGALSGLAAEARGRIDTLDLAGRKVAAFGRGLAAASVAAAGLALAAAFRNQSDILVVELAGAGVVVGVVAGVVLAVALALLVKFAIGRSAQAAVAEARRQLKDVAGLLEGKEGAKADGARCVRAAAGRALWPALLAGVVAVAAPVLAGLLSSAAVIGLVAGMTAVGAVAPLLPVDAAGSRDAGGPSLGTLALLAGCAALAFAPVIASFH